MSRRLPCALSFHHAFRVSKESESTWRLGLTSVACQLQPSIMVAVILISHQGCTPLLHFRHRCQQACRRGVMICCAWSVGSHTSLDNDRDSPARHARMILSRSSSSGNQYSLGLVAECSTLRNAKLSFALCISSITDPIEVLFGFSWKL